jgi:hypothetical protein
MPRRIAVWYLVAALSKYGTQKDSMKLRRKIGFAPGHARWRAGEEFRRRFGLFLLFFLIPPIEAPGLGFSVAKIASGIATVREMADAEGNQR